MNSYIRLNKTKIRVHGIVPIIFTFFIIILRCSPEEPKVIDVADYTKRVTAKTGLYIRENHDINSKTLGLIPYGKTIWIRKEFSKSETINGLSGKWVYVEAYFGKSRPKQTGWAFNAYLGEKYFKLNDGFREFKAGCIGIGCNVCGSIVFDPDGFFLRSIYCEGPDSYKTGRWKKIDDYIIACTDKNCNLDISDPNILKFSMDKSGKIILEEKGSKKVLEDSLHYWEPGGWEEVKERNQNLLPTD